MWAVGSSPRRVGYNPYGAKSKRRININSEALWKLGSVLAYLYRVTKYTKVLQLAILMTHVRQKIARIHPIQAMKKGVQPHL
jgi:hypothetical protein